MVLRYGVLYPRSGDTDSTNRPITLPQLANAIADSQLVGSVRGGVLRPGFLFSRDWETTHNKTLTTIEKFLTLFSDGAPAHWSRERRAGGFLCTNLGIAALLRVFNASLEFKRGQGNIEYDRLSPDAIIGSVTDIISLIIDWFNDSSELDAERFRGRYGSGAPIRYAFALMEIIHESNPSFNPPGLDEYIRGYSIESINKAQQLITDIEDTIRDMTMAILKSRYGEEPEDWWRGGCSSECARKRCAASGNKRRGWATP